MPSTLSIQIYTISSSIGGSIHTQHRYQCVVLPYHYPYAVHLRVICGGRSLHYPLPPSRFLCSHTPHCFRIPLCELGPTSACLPPGYPEQSHPSNQPATDRVNCQSLITLHNASQLIKNAEINQFLDETLLFKSHKNIKFYGLSAPHSVYYTA